VQPPQRLRLFDSDGDVRPSNALCGGERQRLNARVERLAQVRVEEE
jgi:hypothetical protein